MTIGYRSWVTSQSRIFMALAPLFLLGVFGFLVEPLQVIVGVRLTQILSWTVLLFVLYTWAILAASIISGSE